MERKVLIKVNSWWPQKSKTGKVHRAIKQVTDRYTSPSRNSQSLAVTMKTFMNWRILAKLGELNVGCCDVIVCKFCLSFLSCSRLCFCSRHSWWKRKNLHKLCRKHLQNKQERIWLIVYTFTSVFKAFEEKGPVKQQQQWAWPQAMKMKTEMSTAECTLLSFLELLFCNYWRGLLSWPLSLSSRV